MKTFYLNHASCPLNDTGETMISNPAKGRIYQVWYRKSNSHLPYHGRDGECVIRGTGRPKNHLLRIDDRLVIVPCGNLRKREVPHNGINLQKERFILDADFIPLISLQRFC